MASGVCAAQITSDKRSACSRCTILIQFEKSTLLPRSRVLEAQLYRC